MSRLAAEQQRLYGPADRALVLGLHGPGSWGALGRVWRGVQADLQLPAPAIAVSGTGHELWFSVAQPVAPAQATDFLQALCARYLAEVPTRQLQVQHAPGADALPPREVAPGRWCAFVAPDLASLFAEEPWIDMAPGADAQADLLAGLAPMAAADLARALLPPAPAAQPAPQLGHGTQGQARAFLQGVMQDAALPMPLRLEAAKALLAERPTAVPAASIAPVEADELPELPGLRPGRYRHYKGGEYEVLGVARHSESLEALVVYRPLAGSSGWWVRPHAMFVEDVVLDGRREPRFRFIGAEASERSG